jgi:hypothetical protein
MGSTIVNMAMVGATIALMRSFDPEGNQFFQIALVTVGNIAGFIIYTMSKGV